MINRNLSVDYLLNNLKFDLKGKFLLGVFWTPNEFLLFHSLTIFSEFFFNLFQGYAIFPCNNVLLLEERICYAQIQLT